ncbi:MAG: type II toxin-antitoxin system VapC family toxin [Victivallales bacterium]|nr:type II toxin-antitoxin system VapC family toxin [Victivallales bacterium]
MDIYFDTSVLVKFYVPESGSGRYFDFLDNFGRCIFINPLHELEFSNALSLKVFRKEITNLERNSLMERFESDGKSGLLVRKHTSWNDLFGISSRLSGEFASELGSRTLDVMHVAAALSWQFKRFMSNDSKQSLLANHAGLELVGL